MTHGASPARAAASPPQPASPTSASPSHAHASPTSPFSPSSRSLSSSYASSGFLSPTQCASSPSALLPATPLSFVSKLAADLAALRSSLCDDGAGSLAYTPWRTPPLSPRIASNEARMADYRRAEAQAEAEREERRKEWRRKIAEMEEQEAAEEEQAQHLDGVEEGEEECTWVDCETQTDVESHAHADGCTQTGVEAAVEAPVTPERTDGSMQTEAEAIDDSTAISLAQALAQVQLQEQELYESRTAITDLQSALAASDSLVASLRATLDQSGARVSSLEDRLAQLENELSSERQSHVVAVQQALDEASGTSAAQQRAHEQAMEEAATQVNQLTLELEQREEALQAARVAHEGELASLRQEASAAQQHWATQIASLEKEIAASAARLTDLSSALSDRDARLIDLQSSLSAAHALASQREAALGSSASAAAAQSAELADVSQRLTDLEAEHERVCKLVPSEKMILQLVKATRDVQKKSERRQMAAAATHAPPAESHAAVATPAPKLIADAGRMFTASLTPAAPATPAPQMTPSPAPAVPMQPLAAAAPKPAPALLLKKPLLASSSSSSAAHLSTAPIAGAQPAPRLLGKLQSSLLASSNSAPTAAPLLGGSAGGLKLRLAQPSAATPTLSSGAPPLKTLTLGGTTGGGLGALGKLRGASSVRNEADKENMV